MTGLGRVARSRAAFRARVRVRKRVDYLRIQNQGRRYSSRHYLLFVSAPRRPRPCGTLSGCARGAARGADALRYHREPKVGNAVIRNRVKRWIPGGCRRLGRTCRRPRPRRRRAASAARAGFAADWPPSLLALQEASLRRAGATMTALLIVLDPRLPVDAVAAPGSVLPVRALMLGLRRGGDPPPRPGARQLAADSAARRCHPFCRGGIDPVPLTARLVGHLAEPG